MGDRVGQRVIVVGVTGSGKTTLARALSARLGVLHVELDALNWGPNWTSATPEVFRARAEAATAGKGWVVDGNYSVLHDIVWPRAESAVWLNYSWPVIVTRLVRRTVRRIRTQEEIWNGNRERARVQFLSRDSLFLWFLRSYPRHRREMPARFAAHPHLQVVELRSPHEAEQWLRGIETKPMTDDE